MPRCDHQSKRYQPRRPELAAGPVALPVVAVYQCGLHRCECTPLKSFHSAAIRVCSACEDHTAHVIAAESRRSEVGGRRSDVGGRRSEVGGRTSAQPPAVNRWYPCLHRSRRIAKRLCDLCPKEKVPIFKCSLHDCECTRTRRFRSKKIRACSTCADRRVEG